MRYDRVRVLEESSEGEEDGCKHCGNLGRYARGLCVRCRRCPEVRLLYPEIGPKRRGPGNVVREPPPAPYPTPHPPGSVGKFKILMERARLGVQLWHPLDARTDLR